ncbi:MAG: hypothetical protein ABI624_00170 [Casimicrobiaceae bacterium]
MLALAGDWSSDVERLLEQEWAKLSIFGVTWKDYTPLARYAQRIRWINVPFGPASSAGFATFQALERLELSDVLKPSVDFRALPALRSMEILWSKILPAEFIANQSVERLILSGMGTPDLASLAPMQKLQFIELKGGRLRSLAGVEHMHNLRTLKTFELKYCTDVRAIESLVGLSELEIDCPKASVPATDWIHAMPHLQRLSLFAIVERFDWHAAAAHPALSHISVSMAEGYALSDAQIANELARSGREILSFKSFRKKAPGFIVELEPRKVH